VTRTGCCGWSEPHGKYFQDFDVIEVQETFYQPGRTAKCEKWRAEAPVDFQFVMKAWQLITHEASSPTYRRLSRPIPAETKNRYGSFRPTDEVFAAWEATVEAARALAARIILFQCPASFAPSEANRDNLRGFFSRIDRGSFVLAWEPRGGWEEKDIKAICDELALVHCVDPFKASALAGQIRYFRLHGLPGYDLGYKYSDDDLVKLHHLASGDEVYVMFNNYSMLDDCRRFVQLFDVH